MQRLLDARAELIEQNRQLDAKVKERTEQLEQVNAALARDIERRTQLEQELRILASTDALTGLANRSFILSYIERRLEQARRDGTAFGLMLFDFDRFKIINDTHGHAVGDEVLKGMADRIQKMCRSSDVVARLGGDEFLLAFENFEDEHQATALGKRLQALFDTPIRVNAWDLSLGVSIGIALFGIHGQDLETLMAAADTAMYDAKRQGGGWVFATLKTPPPTTSAVASA